MEINLKTAYECQYMPRSVHNEKPKHCDEKKKKGGVESISFSIQNDIKKLLLTDTRVGYIPRLLSLEHYISNS
jgi:hypothetical protein